MPDDKSLVINTGPTLAIIAATGDLLILKELYREVHVPLEVCAELQHGGMSDFGVREFENADWLNKWHEPQSITPLLANSLDKGEASVIQLALDKNIPLVAIDERVGRRLARLSGLKLTGSMGILIRAKKEGLLPSIRSAVEKMQEKGIWLSQSVIDFAINECCE